MSVARQAIVVHLCLALCFSPYNSITLLSRKLSFDRALFKVMTRWQKCSRYILAENGYSRNRRGSWRSLTRGGRIRCPMHLPCQHRNNSLFFTLLHLIFELQIQTRWLREHFNSTLCSFELFRNHFLPKPDIRARKRDIQMQPRSALHWQKCEYASALALSEHSSQITPFRPRPRSMWRSNQLLEACGMI